MTLEDYRPEQVYAQLRLHARLIPREERAARWEARACRPEVLGPDEADRVFFSKATRRAQHMCGGCPARVQCALRALEEDSVSEYLPEGTVGGMTATDRTRILLATPALPERKTL